MSAPIPEENFEEREEGIVQPEESNGESAVSATQPEDDSYMEVEREDEGNYPEDHGSSL